MRQLKGQENNLPVSVQYTKVYSEQLVHFYTKLFTDFLPDFTQISNKHLHG